MDLKFQQLATLIFLADRLMLVDVSWWCPLFPLNAADAAFGPAWVLAKRHKWQRTATQHSRLQLAFILFYTVNYAPHAKKTHAHTHMHTSAERFQCVPWKKSIGGAFLGPLDGFQKQMRGPSRQDQSLKPKRYGGMTWPFSNMLACPLHGPLTWVTSARCIVEQDARKRLHRLHGQPKAKHSPAMSCVFEPRCMVMLRRTASRPGIPWHWRGDGKASNEGGAECCDTERFATWVLFRSKA